VERALVNSSKAGDIVADLFGGSGSTLIGCERRSRKARLMEIDPKYVDCIVRRWQQYTGKNDRFVDIPDGLVHRILQFQLKPPLWL